MQASAERFSAILGTDIAKYVKLLIGLRLRKFGVFPAGLAELAASAGAVDLPRCNAGMAIVVWTQVSTQTKPRWIPQAKPGYFDSRLMVFTACDGPRQPRNSSSFFSSALVARKNSPTLHELALAACECPPTRSQGAHGLGREHAIVPLLTALVLLKNLQNADRLTPQHHAGVGFGIVDHEHDPTDRRLRLRLREETPSHRDSSGLPLTAWPR